MATRGNAVRAKKGRRIAAKASCEHALGRYRAETGTMTPRTQGHGVEPGVVTSRRRFFRQCAAVMGAALAPVTSSTSASPAAGAWLVPGYHPAMAWRRGRRIFADEDLRRAIPGDYSDNITLITRVDAASDAVTRALMPLRGHAVTPYPDRRRAAFIGMNHRRAVVFDTDSLDLVEPIEPASPSLQFGGHSLFLPSGELVIAERSARPYADGDDPAAHAGVISVRDPDTTRVIETWPCGGVGPHELCLFADGRHLAVANYGSVPWPDDMDPPDPPMPLNLEPCITVIDLANGRVVDKWLGPDRENEIRHLAGIGRSRLGAIQTRLADFLDAQKSYASSDAVYEPDLTDRFERGYLPCPLLFADGSGLAESRVPDPVKMIYGQSIVYDERHDEFLVTYATSDAIGVFDGATGRVKSLVDTAAEGLRLPRGIALLDDEHHFAVTGYWENLYVFERGTHRLVRERCRYHRWFGHSHIAMA